GPGQGRDGEAVLGAVTSRDGGQGPGGAQVGLVEASAGDLVGLHFRGPPRVGEHVELGGDAEDQRVPQRVAQAVGMRVDQTRQQRPAGARHHLGAGWNGQVAADRGDLAAAHQDVGDAEHAGAVEDVRAADHEAAGGGHFRAGRWRAGRRQQPDGGETTGYAGRGALAAAHRAQDSGTMSCSRSWVAVVLLRRRRTSWPAIAVRLRPVSLATYIAASARRSRVLLLSKSDRSSERWRFRVAMPIEQVTPFRCRGSGWISPGFEEKVVSTSV